MQYVWHHRLWLAGELRTSSGEPVTVIDTGRHNRDAGPDFFNAKVKIGDKMWCGNVEIHVRASDWNRHGHRSDPAYDNVILHVVQYDDSPVATASGRTLPQVTLPCASDFASRYAGFVNNPANTLACAADIRSLPPVLVHDWLDALAFERLYAKADAIARRLDSSTGHWEQALFITLARALGAGINGDAFERTAASLPLRFLYKHSDSLPAIEALLFGRAGLLERAPADGYVESLRREYGFLAHKFGLKPLDQPVMWRMSRMRPASFPHRRLATLAALCYGGFSLMDRILDVRSEDDARRLFADIELTGYWACHYSFGAPTGHDRPVAVGRSTVDMLVINVVAPMLVAYGNATGNDALCHRAVEILEHLPGEKNRYTADFTAAGVACPHALASQAMVQLHTAYCDVRKCLYCRLGHRILAAKARP